VAIPEIPKRVQVLMDKMDLVRSQTGQRLVVFDEVVLDG
jgi:hypothetical protein